MWYTYLDSVLQGKWAKKSFIHPSPAFHNDAFIVVFLNIYKMMHATCCMQLEIRVIRFLSTTMKEDSHIFLDY